MLKFRHSFNESVKHRFYMYINNLKLRFVMLICFLLINESSIMYISMKDILFYKKENVTNACIWRLLKNYV